MPVGVVGLLNVSMYVSMVFISLHMEILLTSVTFRGLRCSHFFKRNMMRGLGIL